MLAQIRSLAPSLVPTIKLLVKKRNRLVSNTRRRTALLLIVALLLISLPPAIAGAVARDAAQISVGVAHGSFDRARLLVADVGETAVSWRTNIALLGSLSWATTAFSRPLLTK